MRLYFNAICPLEHSYLIKKINFPQKSFLFPLFYFLNPSIKKLNIFLYQDTENFLQRQTLENYLQSL